MKKDLGLLANEHIDNTLKAKKESPVDEIRETIEPVVATVKKEEPKKIQNTIKKEQPQNRSLSYNPIFDMSDPRVIYPVRERRNCGKRGRSATIYFQEEEFALLEELAKKHNVTPSQYIRTLILNSK